MAHASRIEFAGAIYHVMNRGNQLGSIFLDKRDRMNFLTTLGIARRPVGWFTGGEVGGAKGGGMASRISLVGRKLPEDPHLQERWEFLEKSAL